MKIIHKWRVYITIEENNRDRFMDEVRSWNNYRYKPLFPPQAIKVQGLPMNQLIYTQMWYRTNYSFVLFSSFWYTMKYYFEWMFRHKKWVQDNRPPIKTE